MSQEAFRLAAVIDETNIHLNAELTAIAHNVVNSYDAGTLSQYDAYSIMATLSTMANSCALGAPRG